MAKTVQHNLRQSKTDKNWPNMLITALNGSKLSETAHNSQKEPETALKDPKRSKITQRGAKQP
jgi:hypothetical protein